MSQQAPSLFVQWAIPHTFSRHLSKKGPNSVAQLISGLRLTQDERIGIMGLGGWGGVRRGGTQDVMGRCGVGLWEGRVKRCLFPSGEQQTDSISETGLDGGSTVK
jgi:hypothetical protein